MISHIFQNIDVFLLGLGIGVGGALIALYFVRKNNPKL